MRGYHKSQADHYVFYRRYPVILTYVDYFKIVSHKQKTIKLLIESLNNGPKNYVLTDEGYIYNYLRVNIKNNSDRILELSQSHLAEKIINHVGLTVSAGLKARDTPAGKPTERPGEFPQ